MKIGTVEINGFAALAPMAGVADRAMREICESFGAAYSVGELTSAKAITLGDMKSPGFLERGKLSRFGSQLFGSEPEIMAQAAKTAEEYQPDFIDINMGCPAPKVANSGGGSSLMKDPVLAAEVVKAVVSAVNVPVTVKMRAGWDENTKNAVEVARRCEEAGAAAITVHGRTRQQMYAPPCDLAVIRAVKQAVKVPVVGNGDVTDGPSAKRMVDETGCDFIMVGRAANGAPWVFSQINDYMEKGVVTPPPSLEERLAIMIRQINLMLTYKSEKTALLESRKHAAWYMKGVRNAASLRRMCSEITTVGDLERICEKALAAGEDL